MINSHQKRLIYSQLDQLDFGKHPYIFELSHMISKQEETLNNIEEYLTEHHINTYTYPLITIANVQNYIGKLMVLNDIAKCPKFFKRKTKQLNAKENQKLKYVQLKQIHMENLLLEEFEPILADYTKSHKQIYGLQNELNFIKRIIGEYE